MSSNAPINRNEQPLGPKGHHTSTKQLLVCQTILCHGVWVQIFHKTFCAGIHPSDLPPMGKSVLQRTHQQKLTTLGAKGPSHFNQATLSLSDHLVSWRVGADFPQDFPRRHPSFRLDSNGETCPPMHQSTETNNPWCQRAITLQPSNSQFVRPCCVMACGC